MRLTEKQLRKIIQSSINESINTNHIAKLENLSNAVAGVGLYIRPFEGDNGIHDEMSQKINEYANHINTLLKQARGSGEAEKFLQMCKEKVESEIYYFSNKRNPKNNVYIEITTDFQIIDMESDKNPKVYFEFTMIKASSGRKYNIERDGNGWFNQFYTHMSDWHRKLGTGMGNSVWFQVPSKDRGIGLIPIPKSYLN